MLNLRPLVFFMNHICVNFSVFLLQSGCNVNSQSYSGNTALHGACGRGQVDTVRLLLKSGADSSLKNYHNDTPVMVAKNKKVSKEMTERENKHYKENLAKSTMFTVLFVLVKCIITWWKIPFIFYFTYIRMNAKSFKNVLESALIRRVGRNSWRHNWKVNVHILPSRGQTWMVQCFLH